MNEFNPIIERLCKAWRFPIDPNWIRAIIIQESSCNPWAMRYEPDYKYLFQVEKYRKWNTVATETMLQKTSFGLGQVMGGLAREQGLEGSLGQLLDPNINLQHVCKRISYLLTLSKEPTDVFACYNAGPGGLKRNAASGHYNNQAYVDSVLNHLQNLRK